MSSPYKITPLSRLPPLSPPADPLLQIFTDYEELEAAYDEASTVTEKQKATENLDFYTKKYPVLLSKKKELLAYENLKIKYLCTSTLREKKSSYDSLADYVNDHPRFQQFFETLPLPLEHTFDKIYNRWFAIVGSNPAIGATYFKDLEAFAEEHPILQDRVDQYRQPEEMEFNILHSTLEFECAQMRYVRGYQTYCKIKSLAQKYPALTFRVDTIVNPLNASYKFLADYVKSHSNNCPDCSNDELKIFIKAFNRHSPNVLSKKTINFF